MANNSNNGTETPTQSVQQNDPFNQIRKILESKITHCFCSPDREAFVTLKDEHRENTHLVDSQDMHEYILCLAYKEAGLLLSEHTVEELVRYMKVIALTSGITERVQLRTARLDDSIEIDLNNDAGECISVRPGSWEIAQPKSCFIRPRTMGTLPTPKSGGSQSLFFKYFRTQSHYDLELLIGFALYTLWPDGPYPILNLKGPKGSGKSFSTEVLKMLTDPVSKGTRRSACETVEQLFVAAKRNWILTQDNLSAINGKMSDALCQLSTGGAYGKRAHYTNDEEHLIELRRPVILNGIPDLASRTDLVSRLLMIEFAPLAKTIPERELREQFEADRSLMLGYLLDGLAAAMKHIDTTDITSKARLIDFLKVVTAAEVGLGWERGTFQKAFEMNQNNLTSDTLILNPVVRALQSFMAFSADTTWEGTMAELHDNLSNYAGNERRSESWPKTARYLSSELDRLKEDLPKVGIELEKLERTPSRRGLRIKRLPTFQIQDEDADAPKGQKVPLDPSIFDI